MSLNFLLIADKSSLIFVRGKLKLLGMANKSKSVFGLVGSGSTLPPVLSPWSGNTPPQPHRYRRIPCRHRLC